jgi:outer membrane protein OmpA-like peptidoglycan-associated protein
MFSSGQASAGSLKAGLSWKIQALKNNTVLLACGYGYEPGFGQSASISIENTGYSVLSVRLGYTYRFSGGYPDGIAGISAGIGVDLQDFSIDYSYLPYGELGGIHAAGLTYYLPGTGHEGIKRKKYLPKEDKRVISFETAYFAHDAWELTADTRKKMDRDIMTLRENRWAELRITGHTSKSGSREYNQKLSEKRALAIRNYFIREGGIDPDRLFIIGYGDTHPAVFEADPAAVDSDAAKQNRRAMFEVINQ